MKRICLALPTNRPCTETIVALHGEAVWAAARFDVEIHVLIIDSCDPAGVTDHEDAVRRLDAAENVVVHHLDEDRQRVFLSKVIAQARAADPDRLLDLMLPDGLSYGACTNRLFLIATALGCASVHRRDSDCRYLSTETGEPVYPIQHELAFLGAPAAEVAGEATKSILNEASAQRPVSLVGGSIVGEMTVDIAEIRSLDPEVYHEVVSLWAPVGWGDPIRRRWLVNRCFVGAGTETFTEDRTTLGAFDPYGIEMSNVAFDRGVYERVPLPPARDTIGTDYFLIRLVHGARLPAAVHNRHILNYYTPERRTDAGFVHYQFRFVKFLLSMLYFNFIYDRAAEAGEGLLDERHLARPDQVAELVRRSLPLDRAENRHRLAVIDAGYRRLGGRYAAFADLLAARGPRLLDEAAADMADFALLMDAWSGMVEASDAVGL